jgi:hypothetical protein
MSYSLVKVSLSFGNRSIPDTDLAHDAIKEKLNLFNACINAAYAVHWPSKGNTDLLDILNSSNDETTLPADSEDRGFKCHNYTLEEMDKYLSKQLYLPRGGELATARVTKRTRDGTVFPLVAGIPTPYSTPGSMKSNFQDSSMETYTANIIAENMTAMIDPKGQKYSLFKGIVDHRLSGLPKDLTYKDTNDVVHPKLNTLGW